MYRIEAFCELETDLTPNIEVAHFHSSKFSKKEENHMWIILKIFLKLFGLEVKHLELENLLVG